MDDEHYKVNTRRDQERGICVIIRNESPNSSIDWRKGSEIDENSLIYKFTELNYKIILINDCVREEILDKLENIAESVCDESHDSFVCIALSYGERKQIYDNNGVTIRTHEIYNRFCDDMCPNLADKPKVFILDFCLASDTIKQTNSLFDKSEKLESADSLLSDTYVLFSISREFVAESEDSECGSLFVSTLIDVIDKYANTTELSNLTLKVSSYVSMCKQGVNRCNVGCKPYGWRKAFYFSQNTFHIVIVYPKPVIQKTTLSSENTISDIFDLLRMECSDIDDYDVVIASSKTKLNSYAKSLRLSDCDLQTNDKLVIQYRI